MLVSVDDFKQGTLAEAVQLVEQETYKTEEGAIHLIERIWVRAHARTHTHTHERTHIHTYTHARTHARTHTLPCLTPGMMR